MKGCKKWPAILFFALCLCIIRGGLGYSQEDLEKQIWKHEESYWHAWIEGDLEAYLSLLHDSFAGWASSLDVPGDKDGAREFFKKYLRQTRPSAYEMMPCAIKIVGDTAIVHYFLVWIDEHGNRIGDRYRITHTWIEREGKWKVLGGMSSRTI